MNREKLHVLNHWRTYCILSYNMTFRFLKEKDSNEFLVSTIWSNEEYKKYTPTSYADLHNTILSEYVRIDDLIKLPEDNHVSEWICKITSLLTNAFKLEGIVSAEERLHEVKTLLRIIEGYVLYIHYNIVP